MDSHAIMFNGFNGYLKDTFYSGGLMRRYKMCIKIYKESKKVATKRKNVLMRAGVLVKRRHLTSNTYYQRGKQVSKPITNKIQIDSPLRCQVN